VQRGAEAGNLRNNRDRYPDLVRLALDLAKDDALGKAACDGLNVSASLERYRDAIERVGATTAPRRR